MDEFETFDSSHDPYGSEPKTYTAPSKMNDEDDAQNPTNGIAEVIISKHRNGQTGTVKLKFIDRLAKFKSLDEFETFDGSHNPYGSEPKTYTAPSKMNDEDEGEGDGPPPF